MSKYNTINLAEIRRIVDYNGWCYTSSIDPDTLIDLLKNAGYKAEVVGFDIKSEEHTVKVWSNDLMLPPIETLRKELDGDVLYHSKTDIGEQIMIQKLNYILNDKFPVWRECHKMVIPYDDLKIRAQKIAIAAYWAPITHQDILKMRECWCEMAHRESNISHETKVKMRKFFDLIRLEMTLI